jgi:hypothetical protein
MWPTLCPLGQCKQYMSLVTHSFPLSFRFRSWIIIENYSALLNIKWAADLETKCFSSSVVFLNNIMYIILETYVISNLSMNSLPQFLTRKLVIKCNLLGAILSTCNNCVSTPFSN